MITNTDVATQFTEVAERVGHARHYLRWSPLVGFAVGFISRARPDAIETVAGTSATITENNRGYQLTWGKNSYRIIINHRGLWRWQKLDYLTNKVTTLAKGNIKPLHSDWWVKEMVRRDHARYYSESAVQYFQKLLTTAKRQPIVA